MTGTAPKREARRGMRVPKVSMPTAHIAVTIPMVSLSTPSRSRVSGTSGKAAPACRPMTAQAAKIGISPRQDPDAAALLGDTEMTFRAEGRRLRSLDLALGGGSGLLLAGPHVGVETSLGQQLAMPAALGDPATIEDHDLVGVDDGRQAVRDHDGRAATADLFKRILDLLLGARVERARRLVEQ